MNLSFNPIGHEGIKFFAEALKKNETLTTLGLPGKQISTEGVKALAEALKVNKTLTSLDLSGNQIGDAGAQALDEIKRQLDINKRLPEILHANWPKIKPLFMGHNDAKSVFSTLPKESNSKIIGTVLDLEALSAKK